MTQMGAWADIAVNNAEGLQWVGDLPSKPVSGRTAGNYKASRANAARIPARGRPTNATFLTCPGPARRIGVDRCGGHPIDLAGYFARVLGGRRGELAVFRRRRSKRGRLPFLREARGIGADLGGFARCP